MSYAPRVDADRSDRLDLHRTGTLRNETRAPIDVLISNLSSTGCLIESEEMLSLGDLISLGVPGVGLRRAHVSRIDGSFYGCEFLSTIDMGDVRAARTAETIVEVDFPKTNLPAEAKLSPYVGAPAGSHADDSDRERGLSLRAKVATIGGLSIVLWAAIIASVRLVMM